MSSKTKSQLRTENNSSFPNNNSQLITPEILRTFNEDIIDSMVSNEDSGSFTVDSGSLLTTASFDNGTRDMTFTKGDGSTFNVNIPDASGSVLPGGVVSGSSQINYPEISNIPSGIVSGSSQLTSSYDTRYALSGSGVTSIIAGTNITIDQSTGDVTINSSGGGSIDTGSLLVTASNDFSEITFTKGDGSTFLIDGTPRQVIATVYNADGNMVKGTPVYVSGSTGNSLNVYPASASRADRMPATYVLNEALTAGSEGEAILAGFINGVDTSAFAAGDNVYVGANGGYTNQKPTGSGIFVQKLGNVIKAEVNGSGVITGAGRANDLPNITQGYAWVGDSNGVPQAVSTSSWDAHSDLTSLNSFTASQELINSGYNTFTSSADNRLDNIELSTGSYARTDAINFFSGPNNIFTGSVLVSGSGQFVNPIPGAFSFDRAIDYGTVNKNNVGYSYGLGFTGMLNYAGASSRYDNANVMMQADSPSFNYFGITYNAGYQVGNILQTISGSLGTNRLETNADGTTTFRAYGTSIEIGTSNNNSINIGNAGSTQGVSIGAQTQVTLGGGSVVINAPATASGDLQVQGNFTSSLQEGYVWVGDASGTTTTVSTGSFGGGGGGGFPYTGDAVISGSLQVTGSVRGHVVTLTDVAGTTTVNFEDGNMFVLTLPSSANTVITPSNIKAGQTVNIQITQPATTGSCTFASSVKFAGGYPFTATTTGSAVDMITMVSYDGTNVLATGIKNFS